MDRDLYLFLGGSILSLGACAYLSSILGESRHTNTQLRHMPILDSTHAHTQLVSHPLQDRQMAVKGWIGSDQGIDSGNMDRAYAYVVRIRVIRVGKGDRILELGGSSVGLGGGKWRRVEWPVDCSLVVKAGTGVHQRRVLDSIWAHLTSPPLISPPWPLQYPSRG